MYIHDPMYIGVCVFNLVGLTLLSLVPQSRVLDFSAAVVCVVRRLFNGGTATPHSQPVFNLELISF